MPWRLSYLLTLTKKQYHINENDTLLINFIAEDPDIDTISYFCKNTNLPHFNQNIINAVGPDTQHISWISNDNDSGEYELIIAATDDFYTTTYPISIIISNVNQKPIFHNNLPDSSYSIDKGDTLIIPFKAYDNDVGDELFYKLESTSLPHPENAKFSISEYIWESEKNDSDGLYIVKISVSDKKDKVVKSINVYIGKNNLPPEININNLTSEDTLSVKEQTTLQFTVKVSDPNSNDMPKLLFPLNLPPTSLFDTSTGTFTYTPDHSISNGKNNKIFNNVKFMAMDMNGLLDTFLLNILVVDTNTAPYWTQNSIDISIVEGANYNFNFKKYFSGDNENDSICFISTLGSLNSDIWSWLPSFSDAGTKLCTLTAIDNHFPPAKSNFVLNLNIKDSIVSVIVKNPTEITYNSIKIVWGKSSDPEFGAYKIFYDTIPNITENTINALTNLDQYSTSITIPELLENKRYYIRVCVYSSSQSFSLSNTVNTLTDSVPPPTIEITNPDTLVQDSCFLHEKNPKILGTVSHFLNDRYMDAFINGEIQFVTKSLTSWKIDFSSANKYEWNEVLIKAYVIVNGEKRTTEKLLHVFYQPNLTIPSELSSDTVTNRSIITKWKKTEYCTDYKIYRSDALDGNYIEIADTNTLRCKDSLLKINTDYWYKIKGYYNKSNRLNITDTTKLTDPYKVQSKNYFFHGYVDNDVNYSIQIEDGILTDNGYVMTGSIGTNLYILKVDERGNYLWSTSYL